MEKHLNLIKNTEDSIEKRVFPRFPFQALHFRPQNNCKDQFTPLEISNISSTGMKISGVVSENIFQHSQQLEGEILGRGIKIPVHGKIVWAREYKNGWEWGVEFCSKTQSAQLFGDLFSLQKAAQQLRSVHSCAQESDFILPGDLKYWLKGDGTVEVFIWQHPDGEFSRFHILFFNTMVEWEDGKGLKTAELLDHRERETPLSPEDEFTFSFDHTPCREKIASTLKLVEMISPSVLPENASDFLCLKLGKVLA